MVSELASEGAMPLPKPASQAELQVRRRRQIRSSLRRGAFPAKTVALFNPSTIFIPLSLDGSSRSISVEISSRVLVNSLFVVFNRSSRNRSVRSSAELVIPLFDLRRTRKKKQFITPIRGFASEKSQAERKVSDLKNRVGKLRSEIEIEATIVNIEEASHSNDLAALLTRETIDGIQGNGNLYAGSSVGYGMVPLSGNQITEPLFPMYCSSPIESFPAKNAMKSDSGLTYGLPPSWKRSREEANPLISYPAFQNTSNRCGSFSFLGEDISLQIQQQQLEDRLKETEAQHKELNLQKKVFKFIGISIANLDSSYEAVLFHQGVVQVDRNAFCFISASVDDVNIPGG
nr:probable BOI-related E3 ubiquitin-protein ligase 3 [Ipomoea batatas]